MEQELNFVPHEVVKAIRDLAALASSPRSDGFTQCTYKHDLYVLKCYIEDAYKDLPTFVGEEKWEQERLIQILQK